MGVSELACGKGLGAEPTWVIVKFRFIVISAWTVSFMTDTFAGTKK